MIAGHSLRETSKKAEVQFYYLYHYRLCVYSELLRGSRNRRQRAVCRTFSVATLAIV